MAGEELLDPRKAKATEEDADYNPGDSHGDDQGHDAKGAPLEGQAGLPSPAVSWVPSFPPWLEFLE